MPLNQDGASDTSSDEKEMDKLQSEIDQHIINFQTKKQEQIKEEEKRKKIEEELAAKKELMAKEKSAPGVKKKELDSKKKD